MNDKRIIKVGHETDAITRRSNELVTAKFFRLSFQAHRLFLHLLAQVQDDHNEDTEYQFSIYALAKAIGIDRGHLYQAMVGAIDELARVMVELPVIDAVGQVVPNRIVRVGLIKNKQDVRVEADGTRRVDGSVVVTIYKELLPYVRGLKERYTEVELKYILRLTSGYAQKLYDLLKSRAFIGHWRVARDELFELLAIEDGKFALWGDFRRFVLERAQQEINTMTDLAFDIEYVKVGQMVSELVFRLRKGGGGDVAVLPGTPQHQAFKGMLELGLSIKEAERMLDEWWETDPDRITWHLAETKRKKSTGKVLNGVGWFRKGMKIDYREPRLPFSEMRKKATEKRAEYAAGPRDETVRAALQGLYKQVDADAR